MTYDTHSPYNGVVDQQPGLLAETCQVFGIADTPSLANGSQYVLHGGRTQADEENNEENDKIDIIAALAIFSRDGVCVGEGEELCCVRLSFRDEEVGEEKEGNQVEGEACRGARLVSMYEPNGLHESEMDVAIGKYESLPQPPYRKAGKPTYLILDHPASKQSPSTVVFPSDTSHENHVFVARSLHI